MQLGQVPSPLLYDRLRILDCHICLANKDLWRLVFRVRINHHWKGWTWVVARPQFWIGCLVDVHDSLYCWLRWHNPSYYSRKIHCNCQCTLGSFPCVAWSDCYVKHLYLDYQPRKGPQKDSAHQECRQDNQSQHSLLFHEKEVLHLQIKTRPFNHQHLSLPENSSAASWSPQKQQIIQEQTISAANYPETVENDGHLQVTGPEILVSRRAKLSDPDDSILYGLGCLAQYIQCWSWEHTEFNGISAEWDADDQQTY